MALVALALTTCRDSTPPKHLTHAIVGTYDVQASYVSHITPSGTSSVNASLTGIIIIGDTVEYSPFDDHYFFPDVRMTAVFCSGPGTCTPMQSWTAFTSLFAPNAPVTFGFGGIVHLQGPYMNGGFSGDARYWVGADQRDTYVGTFVATKR
jgi:hypothetical protein